jgi:hypothetical protein
MDTEARVFGDVSSGLWREEFEGTECRETLARLISINQSAARENALYRSENEKLEAARIARPITNEKAFATLGLLLGSLPPASIFAKVLSEANGIEPEQLWLVGLLLLVNLGSAVTGFYTGKIVGRWMTTINRLHILNRAVALTTIGLLWGVVAGAAGGVLFFVVGAFVGAIIGGIVGGAALPVFSVLYNFLRRGDVIDKRYLLPLAFGITLTICGFVLGLG